MEFKSTLFGDLYQSRDLKLINNRFINLVLMNLKNQLKTYYLQLKFLVLKSNAVGAVNNKQTVGLGHGQTNRYDL